MYLSSDASIMCQMHSLLHLGIKCRLNVNDRSLPVYATKKIAKLITHTFNSVSIPWLKQLGEIDRKQMSVSI